MIILDSSLFDPQPLSLVLPHFLALPPHHDRLLLLVCVILLRVDLFNCPLTKQPSHASDTPSNSFVIRLFFT